MFTTPKNIAITTLCLALALFAFTQAIKVSEADNQILTIIHEIKNNSTIWEASNKRIEDAQKIIEIETPIRDKAQADNESLRTRLVTLTKGTGKVPSESDRPVDAGDSGKTQPTE